MFASRVAKTAPSKARQALSAPSECAQAGGEFSGRQDSVSTAKPLSWSIANVAMLAHKEPRGFALPEFHAAPIAIQRKLAVGRTDDPLEHEAERVAEHVMLMPGSGSHAKIGISASATSLQRKCSCGGTCDKCQAQKPDDEKRLLQRKPVSRVSEDTSAQFFAPPIVHEVLRSSGWPLDAATRAFFEPRLGYDLERVRVHSDALAADSAAAVGALAYTVGQHVVFGGQRSPASASNRRLLAHELAHVMQQDAGSADTLRRSPCMQGDDCKFRPGDPGMFGEKVDGTKPGGPTLTLGHPEITYGDDPSSATPPPSRQGLPATNLKKLAEDLGFKFPPEAAGVFIDETLSGEAEAQAPSCKDFPGGNPKGADKDKCCIQVYPEMDNRAKRLLNSNKPRTEGQKAEATSLLSTVMHEAEHCHFDRSADTEKKIPAEKECDLKTVVFHGTANYTVKYYLSELSAEITEFAPYFQHFQASQTKANHDLLHQEEISIALNKGESIRGIIHGLKCACPCDSADHFIENAVHNIIDSWPKEQADKFLQVMTRILPSWWPAKLRKN